MPVSDIVTFCPEAQGVLAEYGLHCFGCEGSAYETLEVGARTHGMQDDEIDALVIDLNEILESGPRRARLLTVTTAAARAIRGVAEEEKRLGEGLAVIVDGSGGFCMEFRQDPDEGEETFTNAEVPDVRIFASDLTLRRIGGSTVDFRDGRFKLDLPTDDPAMATCGCAKEGGRCGCRK